MATKPNIIDITGREIVEYAVQRYFPEFLNINKYYAVILKPIQDNTKPEGQRYSIRIEISEMEVSP